MAHVHDPERPVVLKVVRFPLSLHKKLVQTANERSAEAGKRVSLNQVILDLLEQQLERNG